jgi:hypothetical protein
MCPYKFVCMLLAMLFLFGYQNQFIQLIISVYFKIKDYIIGIFYDNNDNNNEKTE